MSTYKLYTTTESQIFVYKKIHKLINKPIPIYKYISNTYSRFFFLNLTVQHLLSGPIAHCKAPAIQMRVTSIETNVAVKPCMFLPNENITYLK